MIPTIKLNDHLCFKLYVASRTVMRAYADELAPLRLTYPKYVVLVALGELDGQTVGGLAECLSLDFGTISPLVKSLEQLAYVERRRRKEDERSVAVHLTAAGRDALEQAMAITFQLFCRTEMSVESLVTLRNQVDDYITRCQLILDQQKESRA